MSSALNPREPTPEQLTVLLATDRIRVVRACPGAGKTEMFVEAIRRELATWKSPSAGIAALSFTNIARQTIENRAGGTITAPHFVGTLDSFIFRFVVKPFGHLAGLPKGRARLFPAVMADHLDYPLVQVGTDPAEKTSLYKIHYSYLREGKAAARTKINFKLKDIPAPQMAMISEKKKEFWAKTGIVTHSDCHLIAARILAKPVAGEAVRKLIARRFPVLFIDELQDTGFFLAKSFRSLCASPDLRALVVGDPNQAIYGFGGASPTIFDDFANLPGAKTYPLTLSQRCPKKVAQVVSQLSYSNEPVGVKEGAIDGEVKLVVHTLDRPKLLPPQAALLKGLLTGADFAVIARKGVTASDLRGHVIRDAFQGSSGTGKKINRAVEYMASGDAVAAAQIIDRELCRILFDSVEAGPEDFEKSGITRARWRSAQFAVLATAAKKIEGESWNDWVKRLKETVRVQCIALGWKPEGSKALASYRICNTDGIKLRSPLLEVALEPLWDLSATVSTVHKVKGAEFDTVIVFIPKPTSKTCPSKQWWSAEEGGEERRVAFVATSRAKQKLILCIHEKTFAALKISRPGFIALFGDPTILS